MATLNEEVGKLIARRLLAAEAVQLPEIGSLIVKRVPARKVARGVVEPPYRAIEFRAEAMGLSLVEDIRVAARCSEVEARDAYDRWRQKSLTEQGLRIEGVGLLHESRFTPDAPFEKRLNPRGHAPVKVRRPMPWWAWSLITLLIITLIFGGLSMLINPVQLWRQWQSRHATPAVEQLDPAPTLVEEPAPADTLAVAPVLPAPEPQPAPVEPSQPVRTRSGMSYVVLGIYSTPENAERAIQQAEQKYQIAPSACSIFLYADKYLVALGETEKRADAQAIAARYRQEHGVKDVWVYSKN